MVKNVVSFGSFANECRCLEAAVAVVPAAVMETDKGHPSLRRRVDMNQASQSPGVVMHSRREMVRDMMIPIFRSRDDRVSYGAEGNHPGEKVNGFCGTWDLARSHGVIREDARMSKSIL